MAKWSTKVRLLIVFSLLLTLTMCLLTAFIWTTTQSVIFLMKVDPASRTLTTPLPRFVPADSLPVDHPDLQYMRKFGRTRGLPTPKDIVNMTRKELTHIYHSYLDNIDYLCQQKIRMGRTGDGGWEVCDDYEFRPIQPCVVYSFGINHDFSFDDDTGAIYKCDVFSFDPSMHTKSYKRSPHVRFLNMGLSGEAGLLPANVAKQLWDVKTLTDIKAMLGHRNKTIDILKMDIEYSEWPALVDILKKGELNHVRQFVIEFHTRPNDSEDAYRQRLSLLAKIEALGFRRFCTHKNPLGILQRGEYPVVRVSAMEVGFVNTRFRRLKKDVM